MVDWYFYNLLFRSQCMYTCVYIKPLKRLEREIFCLENPMVFNGIKERFLPSHVTLSLLAFSLFSLR